LGPTFCKRVGKRKKLAQVTKGQQRNSWKSSLKFLKKEKAEAKKQENSRATVKRRREDEDPDDSNAGSEDFDFFKAPEKRVLTTIAKWQKGHRRARVRPVCGPCAARNKLVEKVTCASWEEAVRISRSYR
jgi:hypothetical protein